MNLWTVRGNANMAALCEELDVSFSRCGSLLVTYDESAVSKLERKLQNGIQNGVPGLRLLSGGEAETLEPMLKPGVVAALYAPSTGTVNPWQLGIAAYENALQNGAEAMLQTSVLDISRTDCGYVLKTNRGEFSCKMIFNCAGLSADQVQELLFPPSVRLHLLLLLLLMRLILFLLSFCNGYIAFLLFLLFSFLFSPPHHISP